MEVIPAPAVLLDGEEGVHVVAGQAEHRFGAIDLCSPVPVLANLGWQDFCSPVPVLANLGYLDFTSTLCSPVPVLANIG